MTGYRPPPHDFGLSWGMRGFRFGRSQYGTWWISVRLPFGFRIARRLGRLRDPKPNAVPANVVAGEELPTMSPPAAAPQTEQIISSRNQEILARMKSKQT